MASREISQVEEQGACCPPPPDAPPILCVNNCGFFGTRENNDMCSCCCKKALMASINPSPSPSSLQQASPAVCLVKEGSSGLSSATDPSASATYVQPDPTSLKEASLASCSVKKSSPSSPFSTSCAERSPAACSMKEPSLLLPSSTSCAEPDPTLSTSSTCASPPPQKPNRCFSCRKRVGLTGFKCRCGDVFCSLHRYSDKHDCSFDYKAAARGTIAKQNPVVKADKVMKI